MLNIHNLLCNIRIDELHAAILTREVVLADGQPSIPVDHGDLEKACMSRIAAIPRLPVPKEGRWWHYAQAQAYPYGNS